MEYVTHAPHSARPIRALAAGGRREYVGRIWFVRLFHGSSQPDDSAQLYRRVISSLLNISVSRLGYKWFVFKTKRNYLRE
jgi:hypothetical protein